MGPRGAYSKKELALIKERKIRNDITLKINKGIIINDVNISYSENVGYAYDNKKYDDTYCDHDSVLIKCLFLKTPIKYIKRLMLLNRKDILPLPTTPDPIFTHMGPIGLRGPSGACHDPLILDQSINTPFYLGLACVLHSDEAIDYFLKYFESHVTSIFCHVLKYYDEKYVFRIARILPIQEWFLHYYLVYLATNKEKKLSIKLIELLTIDNSYDYVLPYNTWYYDMWNYEKQKLSVDDVFKEVWITKFILVIGK